MSEEQKVEAVEKEQPTEIDAERIFRDFQKAMETMQVLLKAAVERLEADGVDGKHTQLIVEPNELTVKVGDILLWHRIEHHTMRISH